MHHLISKHILLHVVLIAAPFVAASTMNRPHSAVPVNPAFRPIGGPLKPLPTTVQR